MEIKSESVEDFYNSIEEDSRLKRKNTNQIEFLTTIEYLNKSMKPNSKILDACAGGGIYSFYLADQGHHIYAGDLVEKNVEDIRRNQNDHSKLKEIFVGSILDLHQYDDESFDVVLNLGSHYHLIEEAQRRKSLEESMRVLKNDGIYAISYVNRYSNIIKFREMFTDNFELMNEYLETGFHSKNRVFFCTTPELIEEEVRKFGLQIMYHVATDGMKFIIGDVVNELTEEKFMQWMDFHLKTCEDKSILGSSEHGLIIARKV
jgi:2-polyprenyl-3-methyl-5-hydroxy-6-metoxy-1,4-benzoquinol methylase